MDVYTRIVRAKLYIDDHYASAINLDQLSGEACFSKYHFLRLFKKAYNKTPHQYLSERRIEKAKEKLKRDQSKISSVCEEVGFESHTSFALKFRKYTGETPAVFRLRQRQTLKLAQEQPCRFVPHCFAFHFSQKH